MGGGDCGGAPSYQLAVPLERGFTVLGSSRCCGNTDTHPAQLQGGGERGTLGVRFPSP